jgi:starch synthase
MWCPGPRAAQRRALGVGSHEILVVWHGRLDMWRKGLDVLADAWSRVTMRHSGSRPVLLVIGDGPDAEAVHARLAVDSRDDVIMLRQFIVDTTRIRDLLRASDVYAFPSRWEGSAVAPAEAIACGLPVVAADCPGIRDLLPGGEASGGLIVPVGDPAAFAEAIVRVLDDTDLRRTMGAAARRRAETALSPEAVGSALRAFLCVGATARG